MSLLTVGTGNLKLGKSDKNSKFLSCGVSLLPAKYSGYNTCKFHSNGCAINCINFAGLGKLSSTQNARLKKTKLFFENKDIFFKQLYQELHSFVKKAKFLKKKPVCRLNIFSDLPWEQIKPEIFSDFSSIQFMDYTKWSSRYQDWLDSKLPSNYHLTFSRSEINDEVCKKFLANGGNVAMVFRTQIPRNYWGYKTINGDVNDLRFLDKKNTICALIAKGRGKKDSSGFIIDII